MKCMREADTWRMTRHSSGKETEKCVLGGGKSLCKGVEMGFAKITSKVSRLQQELRLEGFHFGV